ncbi:hypothetical protein [Caballeronia sp. INML2]|nr:hypothetical protein [Caballeronia sp. INML2]
MTENNVISLRGLEMIITYRGANHERRDNLSAVSRVAEFAPIEP